MNDISFYLKKYSNVGLESKTIKESVISSIKEICNIDIEYENIKINNKNLVINVLGPEKTEIFINKEKIQENIIKKINKKGYKTTKKRIL